MSLTNLKELDLCYNKISTIEDKAFDVLVHLEKLNLGFNKLNSIKSIVDFGLI